MNNTIFEKTMEKLRNKIDVTLVSNIKDYLKWTSKRNYISQETFYNDLKIKLY